MLEALGTTIWLTDRQLRIVASYGRQAPESHLDRGLADFFRAAWGVEDPEAEPIAAHRAAQAGKSVTLQYEDGERRVAIIVEPREGPRRRITGTVAMAIELTDSPHHEAASPGRV